jgi:NADPH:quinone reductase-like Zn-dependent oxidoreductase
MKAWEIRNAEGIDALSLVDRPTPVPGPHEVVVRIRAVSLNYRDLLHVLGFADSDRWPLVPCSDGAGEIIAVGAAVSRFAVGDRVAGTFFQRWVAGEMTETVMESAVGGRVQGMLAEQVCVPEDALVAMLPGWTFAEAATLPCAAVTAWHALVTRGHLAAGETVLALGTGGVAMFALQIAKMHGARCIITSSSDEKLARARALGADETVNYARQPDWETQVLELTGGRGVDHVVELGGAGTLEKSCLAARYGGKVWLIGVLTGFAGTANPLHILRKSLTLQGIYVGSREMFEAMNQAFAASGLRPVIDRAFGFGEAREAFHCMQAAGHFGKLVINVD